MYDSFAATIYSLIHFRQIYKSGHNIIQKALFHVQLIYNLVSLLLSWFSLASFLITIFVIMDITGSPSEGPTVEPWPFGSATTTINAIIQVFYVSMILMMLIVGTLGISQSMNALLS